MKIPLRNDSHEKVCALKYFVWYAFFVAPAIKQASAIRNVILQLSNHDISDGERYQQQLLNRKAVIIGVLI